MKNYVILLATDDLAVKAEVKALGSSGDCELNCVETSREGALQESVRVDDLI